MGAVAVNPFWLIKHIITTRDVRRSHAHYVAFLSENAQNPKHRLVLEYIAQREAYPAGPDNGWRCEFTRLPKHDKLLKRYDLDEVAGQGSSFERALRVMDWLTAHTWYNGVNVLANMRFYRRWSKTPQMLRFGYDKPFRRALNCGHKAAVLTDCLLAVGMFAMQVAAVGYYSDVKDYWCNHCVVHVWLEEEKRWVVLDPSFNSYFTDSAGCVVNLIELQDLYRKGEEIRVAQYDFNGTQDRRGSYLDDFVLNCLLELIVLDDAGGDWTSGDKNKSRHLLPGDLAPKERAITAAELLAAPAR